MLLFHFDILRIPVSFSSERAFKRQKWCCRTPNIRLNYQPVYLSENPYLLLLDFFRFSLISNVNETKYEDVICLPHKDVTSFIKTCIINANVRLGLTFSLQQNENLVSLYHFIQAHPANCIECLLCTRLRCSGMQSNLEACAAHCRMQSVSCSNRWVSSALSTHTQTHLKTRFRYTQPSLEALKLFIHLNLKINIYFWVLEYNTWFAFYWYLFESEFVVQVVACMIVIISNKKKTYQTSNRG